MILQFHSTSGAQGSCPAKDNDAFDQMIYVDRCLPAVLAHVCWTVTQRYIPIPGIPYTSKYLLRRYDWTLQTHPKHLLRRYLEA